MAALLGLLVLAFAGCFALPPEQAPPMDAAVPFAAEFARLLQPVDGRNPEAHDPAEEADAGPMDGCGPDSSPLSQLWLTVRTVPVGGRYAPRNAGAVWIERGDGTFVRTLERWGKRRAKWLFEWHAAAEGDTTDAITRATLPRHEVHELTWDLGDRAGCEVDNGSYQVRIELTDWSGRGETAAIPFDKGTDAQRIAPPDPEFFRDIELRLE